jgi:molybdenum cofactor synthesis domain-containing protein
VLTVSTSVSRRENEDESGPLLAHLAEEAGAEVEAMEVIPDDFALIEDRLHHYVDDGFALVFTTGGTGFTPDDVTPEATRAVIEREAPGIAEAMRAESLRHTRGRRHRLPHADRQLPGQPEGGPPALPRRGAGARARRPDAAARGWPDQPLSSRASRAATAIARPWPASA